MTKRKRKGRRQATGRGDAGRVRSSQAASDGRRQRTEGALPSRTGSVRSTPREQDRAGRAESAVVYPPLPVSLARGMRAVGSSPPLLIVIFLGALGLWSAYSAYGVDLAASPSGMILLESLPPFHSFLDVQLLAAGRPASSGVVLALGLGVMAARAALLTAALNLILRSLRPQPEESAAVAPDRRRGIRQYPVLLGMQAAFLVLMFAALAVVPSFLGAQLGQLGVIVALLAGIYLLSFAPVIAVSEGVGLREAFRLSVRAARVPGPRHMVLTFSYVAFSLAILISAPVSRVADATPSILIWLYALFVAFLHASVLAALAFRWLFVREVVLRQAAQGMPVRAR